ncbi:MAG: LEA type 2 family protein [Sediminibacterium sp.]|jgi:LEA14-like dessication related protein
MRKYLLAVLTISLLIISCSSPKDFEFKGLQDIKIEKISMGKNKINAKIKYFNPNNFSMVLKQIDCDILMNNQPFTKVHLDTNFVIPANASFMVPAQMEFEMSSLVKNSMDLIFNKPIKLNIKGNATLSKGIFTRTVPIAFESNQKLNLGDAIRNLK